MFIELPVNNISAVMRKPVYGVGINDAAYVTQAVIDGKHELCPYYSRWCGMLRRCYSKKYQEKYPTYIGCSVTSDWLSFSEFKLWMEKQDWENKELDKDLMVQGNKIYSPELCLFVSQAINSLFVGRPPTNKKKGVSWHEKSGKFHARISIDGNKKSLGYFSSESGASIAYVNAKHKNIVRIANEQTDDKIKTALLNYSVANIQLLEVKSND